jgi:hypothetical protein
MTARILITGSREWTDTARIRAVLAYHRHAFPDAILVHGDARGADRIAAGIWRGWDCSPKRTPSPACNGPPAGAPGTPATGA